MFAPNLSNSCCAHKWCTGFSSFSREIIMFFFSQIWALSCEDRQTYAGLLFQGKRQPYITLSYDSEGYGGETSPSPESALRSTRITANVSLWAARCHSFCVEYREGSKMHVCWGGAAERSWTVSRFVQIQTERGLTSKLRPRNKANNQSSLKQ